MTRFGPSIKHITFSTPSTVYAMYYATVGYNHLVLAEIYRQIDGQRSYEAKALIFKVNKIFYNTRLKTSVHHLRGPILLLLNLNLK